MKKNVDTPECTLDEQQFTERPTGLSIDSEPSHGVQASTLQHNASSPNDLIEVLTKALSLAERMAGSVFINPSASSSHSHDEDEVRMALNGPRFELFNENYIHRNRLYLIQWQLKDFQQLGKKVKAMSVRLSMRWLYVTSEFYEHNVLLVITCPFILTDLVWCVF